MSLLSISVSPRIERVGRLGELIVDLAADPVIALLYIHPCSYESMLWPFGEWLRGCVPTFARTDVCFENTVALPRYSVRWFAGRPAKSSIESTSREGCPDVWDTVELSVLNA